MSTTPTDHHLTRAAAIAAQAILQEAGSWRSHERLHLPGWYGLTPQQIFDALWTVTADTDTVTVSTPQGQFDLEGIRTGRTLLVPYLVGAPGRNAGSAGFAALLRDEFAARGSSAAPTALLILDTAPIETVRTAARDGRRLSALDWANALQAAVGGAGADPVLAAVADDLVRYDRVPHDARTLGVLAELAELASASDYEALGSALAELPCYLPDPQITPQTAPRRLALSARWRGWLTARLSPGRDLRTELTRTVRDPYTSERVLTARRPFGLDFSALSLDLFLGTNTPRKPDLDFARPLVVGDAAARTRDSAAAVWLPAGDRFTVGIRGAEAASETAELIWAGETAQMIPVDLQRQSVTVPAGHTGWRFGTLRLPRTGSEIRLAVYRERGSWFPIESRLDLDIHNRVFRCEGDSDVIAMSPEGTVVGYPAIRGEDEAARQPTETEAHLDGETHILPLLVVGGTIVDDPVRRPPPESPGDGPDRPAGGNEDPNEDEGPSSPGGVVSDPGADAAGDDSDDETPTPVRIARSVPHATFDLAKLGAAQRMDNPRFSVPGSRGVIQFPGSEAYFLEDQDLGAVSGLAVEKQILGMPATLAFEFVRTSSGRRVEPDSRLERLRLDRLNGGRLQEFMRSRAALFAALHDVGSVHAVGAGSARAEAEHYCEAYASLLLSLPAGSQFEAEYERLLLCDSVTDPETGEILLAPTNPCAIAFLLALSDTVADWLPRATEVPPEDLASIGMRHLLPAFAVGEDPRWYECVPQLGQPLLWRRYTPLEDQRSEPDAAVIVSRLRRFLEVFPQYRDSRQRLSVVLIEPGDADGVADALKQFYQPLAEDSRDEARRFPALDITLESTAPSRPTELDRELSRPADTPVARVVRDRVRLVKAEHQHSGDRFAHLVFVFRSRLRRTMALVNLDSRAGTTWAGGLAAAPGRLTRRSANETAFHFGTFAGPGDAAAPDSRQLLATLTRRCLELVGGMPRDLIQDGFTRMTTTRVDEQFMRKIYSRAVWVTHLDGLLGLEAFSPHATGGTARYLIDYDDRPDPSKPGFDAITATERVDPYRHALRKCLSQYGPARDGALDRTLQRMNSVSGQWALDTLRATAEQLKARVGVLAAIACVEELDGAFAPSERGVGILVPLDELIHNRPRSTSKPNGEHCDDLLYLWVPTDTARPVHLSGRLMEVKYRTEGGPGALQARRRLEQTARWLRDTFGSTGPTRLFRSRDLAEAIRISEVRAHAFGLRPVPAPEPFEQALQAIGDGDHILDLSFRVGGTRLAGDLVSLELDSSVPARRQVLDGSGDPLGYVRLGHPVFAALASAQALPRPESWLVPAFGPDTPPDSPASTAPDTPAPVPPDTVDSAAGGAQQADRESNPDPRSGSPECEQPGQSLAEEVDRLASDLDTAAAKYGLGLEPFLRSRAQVGPSVIRFRTRALGKQTLQGVQARELDLGREIGVPEGVLVDQEARYVTVDVPREHPETVAFRDHTAVLDRPGKPGALQFILGVAPSGEVRVEDLARLPHLLVAGATGSGKSVFLRGLLCSLVHTRSPLELGLLLIDPKQVDFLPFEDLLHLAGGRIITDPAEAVAELAETLEREIPRRRALLKSAGVTNALEFYEEGGTLSELSQMVVLVDEFADLAASLGRSDQDDFLKLIQRYGQMTRALGIYLVLATQRPSVKVITGDIKANLTARVALKMQARQDSMTILGRTGAETLRDKGDLLFDHAGRTERLQALLCTPRDAAAAVRRWEADSGK